MVKRTSQKRLKVVILRNLGLSWEQFREKMRFSNKSTTQTIYKNYLKNGSVDDSKKSGRPPKLTQKDQNWLRRIVKKNNKASAEKLRVLFNSFSMNTVSTKSIRRNFHKMNLVDRAAAKKLRMRAETRVTRLLWAKQKRNGTMEEWKRVVFSNEFKFSLTSYGRVWRTTGTRYKPENTIEKTTSRFSMMFWGCISGNGSRVLLKTPKRFKSADYIDLLKTAGIDTLGEDQFFMDDNCPIHRSGEVKQWLHDNGIGKEFWPPYSPDFNPIENVWA